MKKFLKLDIKGNSWVQFLRTMTSGNKKKYFSFIFQTAATLQENRYCDQASVSSAGSSDPETTLAMDDITLDDYIEKYSQHLESSSL